MNAAAVLLIAGVSAAGAAPPSKHALALETDVVQRAEADLEAHALVASEEAARAAAYVLELNVLPRSEMSSTHLDAALRACNTNLACISSRLNDAGVEHALLLVADLGLMPPVVTVRVIDARRRAITATSVGEILGGRLDEAVRNEVWRALERAGFHIGGRVIVETDRPDAQVNFAAATLTAEPNLSNIFLAPPGAYEIKAESGGTLTSTIVQVVRGEDRRVWLGLARAAASSESVFTSPWLWAVIGGAAAVAGGVSVFLVTRGDEERWTVCQSRSGACP